jgi:hypothetical protein
MVSAVPCKVMRAHMPVGERRRLRSSTARLASRLTNSFAYSALFCMTNVSAFIYFLAASLRSGSQASTF